MPQRILEASKKRGGDFCDTHSREKQNPVLAAGHDGTLSVRVRRSQLLAQWGMEQSTVDHRGRFLDATYPRWMVAGH